MLPGWGLEAETPVSWGQTKNDFLSSIHYMIEFMYNKVYVEFLGEKIVFSY